MLKDINIEHQSVVSANLENQKKTTIENVIKINTEQSTCISLDEHNNPIIKVRTQSFDDTNINTT